MYLSNMKTSSLLIIPGMVLLPGVILLGLRIYFNDLADHLARSWYLVHCQQGEMCPIAPQTYGLLIQSITYTDIVVFLAGTGLLLSVLKVKSVRK